MTIRERETLAFIYKFKIEHDYAPTISEIKAGINTHSDSHVRDILESLKADGYIDYKKRSPRTIRILKIPI